MNKSDLEKLTETRLEEAYFLLDEKLFSGAYYLAGYVVECALKACIAKQVKENDFPNKELANASYTHNLAALLGTAGLKKKLEKQNENIKLNWAVVKDWKETSRYEVSIEETQVQDLFKAIDDTKSGILTWIKKYW